MEGGVAGAVIVPTGAKMRRKLSVCHVSHDHGGYEYDAALILDIQYLTWRRSRLGMGLGLHV